MIVDPELPNKYNKGQLDDIRMCIACNQGVLIPYSIFKPVSCTYNAMVGHEGEYKITKAGKSKKIVVVGGGTRRYGGCSCPGIEGAQCDVVRKE